MMFEWRTLYIGEVEFEKIKKDYSSMTKEKIYEIKKKLSYMEKEGKSDEKENN